MSPDVIADIDATDGVAQVRAYYVKECFQTDRFSGYAARCRIAVLDEGACVLFPEPIPGVDLRVGFGETLMPEVQSALRLLPKFRAVYRSRGDVEPVGEFVYEEGSHGCVIGAK